MATIPKLNVAYGITDALLNVFPKPIIGLRDPRASDKAQLGTVWVNKSDNEAFVLTSVTNNTANWQPLGAGGVLDSLTVTPGPISLTGTTDINTVGAATTNIGTGTGQVNIGNNTFPVVITDALAVIGNITTTGNVNMIAGDLIIQTAGQGISLPGPTQIINGDGVPDNALALNTGDIYINKTAATADTRLYIATAPGAWATFTASA